MNTKLTIKEMTIDYNRMATDLNLPLVKKLKPTKEFNTVKTRWADMCEQYKTHLVPESTVSAPRTLADPMTTEKAESINLPSKKEIAAHRVEVAGIKHTRPGTSIYYVVEALLIGGTVHELSEYLKNNGVNWTENSLRAALSWDVPKKGYEVEKFTHENGTRYKISNANAVV